MKYPRLTLAIIASLPRTASTLICEALAQHPDALGCGELFIHEDSGRAYYHKKAVGDLRAYPGPHRFAEYVEYLRSVATLEGRELLSFKLMDYQEPLAWQMIENDPVLPLIQTRRENVLECLASSLASITSGAWHGHTDKDLTRAAAVSVPVSTRDLIEWHERKLAFDARLAALPNPLLVLEYEEISRDYAASVRKLYDFLLLRPYCAQVTQKKLNPRPLRDRVANFDELAEQFRATELAPYFAEPL